MKATPSAPPVPGTNRLGDWSLNLLNTRPRLVVAVSEYDRLGLVLEAAPYATLPQRFADAVFVQLLAIGVTPEEARRERDAMLPLIITATTGYANRLSLQANLKDYGWHIEGAHGRNLSIVVINASIADYIVSINGKLERPREFVLSRLVARN